MEKQIVVLRAQLSEALMIIPTLSQLRTSLFFSLLSLLQLLLLPLKYQ